MWSELNKSLVFSNYKPKSDEPENFRDKYNWKWRQYTMDGIAIEIRHFSLRSFLKIYASSCTCTVYSRLCWIQMLLNQFNFRMKPRNFYANWHSISIFPSLYQTRTVHILDLHLTFWILYFKIHKEKQRKRETKT